MDQQVDVVKFSIVVAAFNIEKYIQRALKSVEEQTFKNYELLVVNDCSTDNTEEKILEYCKGYDNIKYFKHERNKKLGTARNTALKHAKGEYIIYLDGDDYLASEDVLEKLDKLIGNDKPDIIYLGFKIEGDREELVIPTEETCKKTYKAAMDKYPNVWSKCWRREFLEDNNIVFPDNRYYEDVIYVYKGVMNAKSYKIANFVVHKYTSGRSGSITTKIGIKNIEDTTENLKELLDMRNNNYTQEIDIIIKKEIRMCKKRLDQMHETIFGKEIEE